MPTLGDAIRDREMADRQAKYESFWTVKLHIVPYRAQDVEEGIAAMRDIYTALSRQPVEAWQREAVAVDDAECFGETLGAAGRGLMIRRYELDSWGNPRDGWPRELHVSTAGLPSMQIAVRLASDMPLSRTPQPWTLTTPMTVEIHSNDEREAIRRAIVDRFGRLGYTEWS